VVNLLDSVPKFSDLLINLSGTSLKLLDGKGDWLELVLSNEVGLVSLKLVNSILQCIDHVKVLAVLIEEVSILLGKSSSLVPLINVIFTDLWTLRSSSSDLDRLTSAKRLNDILESPNFVQEIILVGFFVLETSSR